MKLHLTGMLLLGLGLAPGAQGDALDDVGRGLDRTSRQLEEFGSVSISAPLFSAPGEDFKFDLHRGATNYFDDARTSVQGGAALSQQVVQSLAAQLQGQFDPTIAGAQAVKLAEFSRQQGLFQRRQSLLETASEAQLQADLARATSLTDTTERAKAEADARQAYALRAPGGSNAPVFPTAASANAELPGLLTNKLERPQVRDTLTSQQFTAFQGLMPTFGTNFQPRINNRSALITAAGDVAVESMFRLLGEPQKAGEYSGKEVFFGVATVAVNPGWRTTRGYAANVSARLEVTYQKARREVVTRMLQFNTNVLNSELRDWLGSSYGFSEFECQRYGIKKLTNEYPSKSDRASNPPIPVHLRFVPNAAPQQVMVSAVSPMTDVETLDLATSTRRQSELMLSLIASFAQAGMTAQGSVLEQFVKRNEGDFRSRNAVATVNTYSMGGGVFGFEIGPRWRAIGRLDRPKPKVDEVLDRQTFPVLLIAGVDRASLHPLIQDNVTNLIVWEPVLSISQTPRWAPAKKDCGISPSQSQADLLRRANDLDKALGKLTKAFDAGDAAVGSNIVALAKDRSASLSAQLYGAKQEHRFDVAKLWPDEEPAPKLALAEVTEIFPSSFVLKRKGETNEPLEVRVALLGRHLDQIDLAGIGIELGKASFEPVTNLVAGALVLRLTIANADEPIVFRLPLKKQDGVDDAKSVNHLHTYSRPLLLKVEPKSAAPGQQASATVIRTLHKESGDHSQREFSVEIAPQASDVNRATAEKLVLAELEKAKPASGGQANVEVHVQAQDTSKPAPVKP